VAQHAKINPLARGGREGINILGIRRFDAAGTGGGNSVVDLVANFYWKRAFRRSYRFVS